MEKNRELAVKLKAIKAELVDAIVERVAPRLVQAIKVADEFTAAHDIVFSKGLKRWRF